MNVKENVMQVVLDAITMIENPDSGQVHNLMYDELAESIAERLANNGLLSNVSERFQCSTPDCGITRGRRCFEEKCEDWSGR